MYDYDKWIIIILILFSLTLIYRELKNYFLIKKTVSVLEDIITGNENRRIHVGANERFAPLIFKINQLVDIYQKDKIKIYKAEQARKQLLSNLSHDLRTPLTSILGYIDALCDGIADEETDEYLNIVKGKAYSLKDCIDQLFTIAQLDANEIQFDFQQVDIYELLRSELIGWIPVLEKENKNINVNIPDEECFVNLDKQAVIRVFNNLFQNACRYGGETIGVSAWENNSNVYFEVCDNGIGIPKEEISKVFNRLYKSDSTRTTKGHGLGLTIAKELSKKMNGNIFIESKPNTKTSIRVSFKK